MASREATNLKRLLAHCNELAESELAAREDVRLKLDAYLRSVETRITELRSLAANDKSVGEDVIQKFAAQASGLRQRLDTIKAQSNQQPASSDSTGSESGLGLRNRKRTAREELLNEGESKQISDKDALERDKAVQDQLTEDMVAMLQQIKQQSQATRSVLQEDNEVLDEANELADANKASLAAAQAKLREQIEAMGGCWLWLMLLVVLLVFIFMILFIKITA
eukprot:m.63591 g.63591  ORF g.63591 m.63591 type:complete len:223 (-) comp13862_c0_seq2:172-840(-)